MYSHLLGKKSWNVYNQDNIARVRKDEEAAKAREEEEERRMQEVDAERRLQILRGASATSLKVTEERSEQDKASQGLSREKKRRRIVGEDDTDRDIRLAKHSTALDASLAQNKALLVHKPAVDAPLTDRNGHINLFPDERSRSQVVKNPEVEAEHARKKRELEDQYTMRFSNAAGFKQSLSNPWYSTLRENGSTIQDQAGKDVWGNEDHGRKERERLKREDDDPLASMRRGVQELRTLERERKTWRDTKERELRELKRAQRRHRKLDSSRRHHRDEDSLDGFSLDDPTPSRGVDYSRSRKRRILSNGKEGHKSRDS